MMLRQPEEFARMARQWAVIYAGAQSDGSDGIGSVNMGSQPDPLAKYDINYLPCPS